MEKELSIAKKDLIIIVMTTAIISVLYVICFCGVNILPQLSFTIYCFITFGIITLVIKKLGYLKNKKAFLCAVPIVILSLFNGIFNINVFSYTNVIVMHILFALFIVWATHSNQVDMFSLSMLIKILDTILGNWFIFIAVLKKIISNKTEGNKTNSFTRVLIGIAISFPILFVLVALLSSADMVFHRLLKNAINYISSFSYFDISYIVTFALVWIYTIGYMVKVLLNKDKELKPKQIKIFNVDIIIGTTVLFMINLLFLVFSVVQIAFLFNGGFMTLPDDMVYSQYAREGFFQLLLVTIINFSVIVVFVTVLNGTTVNKIIRFLLFMLCLFTSVLIASSFYRMYLYIDVYGYTILRLSVITFLVMEVFLIFISMAKLYSNKVAFGKLFVSTCFLFYIVVNITGSDYFATKLNIARFLNGKQETVDVAFTGTDGLYLIQSYVDEGHNIILSNAYDNERVYYSHAGGEFDSNTNKMYIIKYMGWQNWSLFKMEGFKK